MATPSVGGATWMTQMFDQLGPRALRAIAVPASHDAGMSTLTTWTFGSTACNTVTQSGDILAQLNAGSRYFDLRPTTWDGLDGFYLGHFSGPAHGPHVGGTGQPLADALQQVARFLGQPDSSREVVILKFSHYVRLDGKPSSVLPFVGDGDFDVPSFQQLVDTVIDEVGPSLFTSSADPPLNDATLAELAAGPGRVVAVFDLGGGRAGGFPAGLVAPSKGIFSYNNLGSGTANLVILDEYSETDELDTMVADQEKKFAGFQPGPGSSFLLSWTLTKTEMGHPCILDLAAQADAALMDNLQSWTGNGTITAAKIPNMIYVDGMQDPSPALKASVFLNNLGS